MTQQFIIEKTLSGTNNFNISGSQSLDLSEEAIRVRQTAKKELKPVQIPKPRSQWGTGDVEVWIFDFKRLTHRLQVDGALIGSNADTTKNTIIAMMEDGGPLSSVKWNDETGGADSLLGDDWWIENAEFTDEEKEGTSNLEDGDVRYRFTMTLVWGEQR